MPYHLKFHSLHNYDPARSGINIYTYNQRINSDVHLESFRRLSLRY